MLIEERYETVRQGGKIRLGRWRKGQGREQRRQIRMGKERKGGRKREIRERGRERESEGKD
jgi:hypothetical protein